MIPVEALPDRGTPAFRTLLTRGATPEEVRTQTEALLREVKERGDAAVLELTERFDGARLRQTRIPTEALGQALDSLDPALRTALEAAAANIAAVHRAQRFNEPAVDVAPGVRVWREWRPLDRVGLYVPGGRAAYVSSVLMMAIPARLAGCPEVVLCSPPRRDGQVPASILAAAALAGVNEVHAIGGVQAIAAMAYGTASLRKVAKIIGPGNAYVTAAKLMVFGEVAIDMPAGPSEIVILTDGSIPAAWVAADLRAQAEHAPDAVAVLVSTDPGFANAVRQLIGDELAGQVQLRVAPDMDRAVGFANAYAPEHLTLACAAPERWVPQIRTAGSVFLGPWSAAAAADYATGANHVLPTGGAGRAFSALGLDAFGRTLLVQQLSGDGLRRIEPIVVTVSTAEALPLHGASVTVRRTGGEGIDGSTALVAGARFAFRQRQTKETNVSVRLRLDGRGSAEVSTGLPFLDHMLRALTVHGRLDLEVTAVGDREVDAHHTVEDVAIVLGESLTEALGDRHGITRFGDAVVPLDEARAAVALDAGGRGYAVIDLPLRGELVGSLPASLLAHFLETFALHGGLTLQLTASGRDDHHVAEASFKALARALRQACAVDATLAGGVASTK